MAELSDKEPTVYVFVQLALQELAPVSGTGARELERELGWFL